MSCEHIPDMIIDDNTPIDILDFEVSIWYKCSICGERVASHIRQENNQPVMGFKTEKEIKNLSRQTPKGKD